MMAKKEADKSQVVEKEATPKISPEEKELLSHHIFLLPFKWQKDDGSAYDIKDFKNKKSAAEDLFIAHYQYDIPPGHGRYIIEAPNPNFNKEGPKDEALNPSKKEYALEIDSILLHLYYTGVGILSFHLNNRKYSDKEDILYINQYGRRVYPNFYQVPGNNVGHQAAFDEDDWTNNGPHGKELAYSLTIDLKIEGVSPKKEKWERTAQQMRKHDSDHFRYKMPEMLDPFLGKMEDGYDIFPIIDDRMFVVCWYGDNDLATELSRTNQQAGTESQKKKTGKEPVDRLDELVAASDDWWYRYVFVDGEMKTVQNKMLQRDLLTKATYTRWSGFQTLYGVTEYSLMLLTKDLPSLRDPNINASFLVTHLQTIYYRLAELVLVQRASIQRFSDDITHITKLDGSNPRQIRLARLLSRRYIRFVNRVYFREATPQQQGIELYDMLQETSRVPEQVGALQQEIDRLQAYVDQIQGQLLTALATLFIAPSLLLAAYALMDWPECLEYKYLISVGAAILAAAMSYLTFRRLPGWGKMILGVLFVLLLFAPLIYCQVVGENVAEPPAASSLTPAIQPPIDSTHPLRLDTTPDAKSQQ
jgi:hypothetical protein